MGQCNYVLGFFSFRIHIKVTGMLKFGARNFTSTQTDTLIKRCTFRVGRVVGSAICREYVVLEGGYSTTPRGPQATSNSNRLYTFNNRLLSTQPERTTWQHEVGSV